MRLVDTSAWIELLRRPQRLSLDDLRGSGEIVTCLPVIQEVLQGIADERAFADIRESMLAWPRVDNPLAVHVFDRAVQITARPGALVSLCGHPSIAWWPPRPSLTISPWCTATVTTA